MHEQLLERPLPPPPPHTPSFHSVFFLSPEGISDTDASCLLLSLLDWDTVRERLLERILLTMSRAAWKSLSSEWFRMSSVLGRVSGLGDSSSFTNVHGKIRHTQITYMTR